MFESLRKLSHDIHGTFENRITYIGQDGTVLFDNEADPATMENHLGREEVVAAKQIGTGTAIRESYTMSEMTVYCARVIGYGCIVRVAGTMDTVAARIAGMWWEVLLVVIIAAMVSLGVAAIVARVVVKPINSIDLKNPDIGESYSGDRAAAPPHKRAEPRDRSADRGAYSKPEGVLAYHREYERGLYNHRQPNRGAFL